MILGLQLIQILIGFICLFFSVGKIQRGLINPSYIFYIVFFGIYVFPVLLDVFFGQPEYHIIGFYAFSLWNNDLWVEVFYSVFVVTVSLTVVFVKHGPEIKIDHIISRHFDKKKRLSFKNVLPLVILILITSIPTFIFSLAYFSSENPVYVFDYESIRVWAFLSELKLLLYYLSFASIFTFAYFCYLSNLPVLVNVLIYLPIIFITVAVNGKRTIFAYLLFMLFGVIFIKRQVHTKFLPYILAVFALMLAAFSFYYQSSVRSYDFASFNEMAYINFRVDYGRDDVVKTAIFAHLNHHDIITDAGNSYLYALHKLFGSTLSEIATPEKYSVYFTNYVLGNNSIDMSHWGITTGLFDEGIANFGIIGGILFSLLVIMSIIRIAVILKSPYVLLTTYIFLSLIISLQLTAFLLVIALWVFTIFKALFERYIQ